MYNQKFLICIRIVLDYHKVLIIVVRIDICCRQNGAHHEIYNVYEAVKELFALDDQVHENFNNEEDLKQNQNYRFLTGESEDPTGEKDQEGYYNLEEVAFGYLS